MGTAIVYADIDRSKNRIVPSPPAGEISFPLIRTTTLGQSVYPDIALHISNYYITYNIRIQSQYIRLLHIRIKSTDCPRVVVRISGNDISPAGGEGTISFMVLISRTQAQSVYLYIALHISKYCAHSPRDLHHSAIQIGMPI
jgi:hypothetical protein